MGLAGHVAEHMAEPGPELQIIDSQSVEGSPKSLCLKTSRRNPLPVEVTHSTVEQFSSLGRVISHLVQIGLLVACTHHILILCFWTREQG